MAIGSHSSGASKKAAGKAAAPTEGARFAKAAKATKPAKAEKAPKAKKTAAEKPEPPVREEKAQMSPGARAAGLVLGGALATLAVVYCLGCVYFYQHFYPNTTIGDANVSLLGDGAATSELQQVSNVYSVSVAGQGVSFTLTGANAGLELNVDAAVDQALEMGNSWLWPVEVFQEHDLSQVLSSSFDTALLYSTVQAELTEYNKLGSDPTNAFLYFDATTRRFQINPGSMGTKLDVDSVVQTVAEALGMRREHAALTSANLVQQQVKATDERLIAARDAANAYLTCDLKLTCAGTVVASVSPETVKDFIVIGEDYSVWLDDAKVRAWVDELEALVDTAGDARAYVRPDGKYIEVAGGTKWGSYYGWISDGELLEAMVFDTIASGYTGEQEIPWKQTAATYNPGGQDWGLRYIDVDLTEQYARFYDENGVCFWETCIISGSVAVAGRDTPTGVFYVTNKARNQTLVGLPDPNNNYEPLYRTLVYYWMPFIDNMVGLHDAYWQSYWGPDAYLTLAGSHGCINVPPAMAEWLYSVIQIGDVVITHY